MGITGDRYKGDYEGHTIEFVLDNWVKIAVLLIDGQRVASESRILPHDITLTGTFETNGTRHTVVTKSLNRFPFSTEIFEVDGNTFPMIKTK
jgi:hypothetical protein